MRRRCLRRAPRSGLAAALAAGADIVGWHTHIADNGDKAAPASFAAMGLRRDQHEDAEDASNAHQRAAWYAFQQMTQYLGSVEAASLLYPDVDSIGVSHEDFVRNESTVWTSVDDVWVLEFQCSSGLLPWAYLLFIDPFGDLECASVALEVASTSGRLSVTVHRQSTSPEAVTLATESAGTFPNDTWTSATVSAEVIPASERSTWSTSVTVARGIWPVLVRSSVRLRAGEPEVAS